MITERSMIHDVVDLIPEADLTKIYAIINAYLTSDYQEELTDDEEKWADEGFAQIERGECITADDYMKKRGLTN
ncbi:MAG: hypothetical protein FWG31_01945 [Oscillospiraceae bacterium]|nr:hypothetical protein [Oscillospiraceae bacterium]